MRIAIPLATKESAFTVFRAIAVPMPQPENDMAIKWKLEAPYLAFSENNDDSTLLTEYNLSQCIGSTRYQLCLEMNATQAGHESCPAILFYKDSVVALQTCETEQIILPSTEKAENLGYGAWLITSATTAYALYESDTESTTSYGFTKYPGCWNCLITLKWGRQVSGPHIKIRSDLSTCEQLPAIKVNVKFPNPMKQLWNEIPALDDIPFYFTKQRQELPYWKNFTNAYSEVLKCATRKKLVDIARSFTSEMIHLRPSL